MNLIKVVYPYNEILPKKSAHDVYVFNNCLSLAKHDMSIELLCGKGSINDTKLYHHFSTPISTKLAIKRLPIIRKNNPLKLTWNSCFFYFCQKHIQATQPNFVISSVLKQAEFHFARKLKHTRYIYEVHQLNWYPNQPFHDAKINWEKNILKQADLIVVTTEALKNILLSPPYQIATRIEIIPLAVQANSLKYQISSPVTLCYVGQLYQGQGIELLVEALSLTSHVHLKIIGGKKEEIESLQKMLETLNLKNRVEFCGFSAPFMIPKLLKDTQVFVAPFENKDRMPFVAHTKLLEYAHWGKPIIAPDLPVVREHFKQGVIYFNSNDRLSLAAAIEKTKDALFLKQLQQEMLIYAHAFSWEKRAENYLEILKSLS